MAIQKIDIHCHTTDRPVKGCVSEEAKLPYIYCRMFENNIEYTVLLPTYFPAKGTGISNFRLRHWIDTNSLNNTFGTKAFIMFGSMDFENYFFQGMNELEEMAAKGLIKGIKLYTGYQKIDVNSDKMKSIIGLAKCHGLPIMFHCGHCSTRNCLRRSVVRLDDFNEMLEKETEVHFIKNRQENPHPCGGG